MLRPFFFVLLSIISLNKSFGQTATLKGKVTDDQLVLSGANALILQNGQLLKAIEVDLEGQFLFDQLQPGTYTLKVLFLGYDTYEKSIALAANETVTLKVNLTISNKLPDLEIIGKRVSQLKSLPGTATKINIETIRQVNPLGTQEMLKYVPGMFGATDDGMGNSRVSIGIRGLNPRRSSRVLFMEDGVPIEPALYIYPNMYYNPPVERLESIEVIKGSAAIKFGPQTMGGVVNYITARPRNEFGGIVQTTIGTNDFRMADNKLGVNNFFSTFIEVGGWGNDKIKPELQLLYKRGDGYRENNSFYQTNGTFKVNFLLNEKKSLYLKANVNYENNRATYTGLTEYSFATNPRFNPKKNDEFVLWRTSLDLIYTNRVNSSLTATTKAYANIFDRNWWRENDVFVDGDTYVPGGSIDPVAYYTPGNLVRVGNGQNNFGNLRTFYVLGIEQSYKWKHELLGRKSLLETGGRYYWDKFLDNKMLGLSPKDRTGVYYLADSTGTPTIFGQSLHFETSALSLYALETFNLSEKLKISPGARVELFQQEMIDRLEGSKYRDTTMAVFLPGIGLNYELKKINIFAGIHKGYTPPSSGTLNATTFINQKAALDVKSEKSWNYEVGARGDYQWGDFEVSGFYLNIKDIIAFGRGGNMLNLGRALTYGIENRATLRFSTLHKLLPDLYLSYTLLKTEMKSGIIASAIKSGHVDIAGNELPYAPRHYLVAGIGKEFDFGLSVKVNYTYVSEVYTDYENLGRAYISNRGDSGPVPAYSLWDFNAGYKFNNHWNCFLTVKNVFDNVYIGSRLHSDPYLRGGSNSWNSKAATSSGILPGERRQINIGVRYLFGKN